MSVHNRSGKFGGRTMVVTCNLRTYYTLYCMLEITSWNWRNWETAAGADAVGEQQLEWTQPACSLVRPCKTNARQSPYPHKAVGASE